MKIININLSNRRNIKSIFVLYRTKDILYSEWKSGHWDKYEYKIGNHNEIYAEDSNGWWCKFEYDERNNVIYCETSYGGVELDKRI